MSTHDQPRILDLRFQGRTHAIASYLFTDGSDAALIETGPSSTIPGLLAGLDSAGVQPEQVTKLLLTHIHLDHAGAAGVLTRLLPNAVVYVHEAGAAHMIDPSKLLASATRIYGVDMDRLWGEVAPVPEERLVVVPDRGSVDVPGASLEALYTPGHASHHIAWWDSAARAVYTGDVAGVRLPGVVTVLPPTPPPDLDLDLWSESIDTLLALQPEVIYLTHFGDVTDPERHFEELRRRLYEWRDLLLQAARSGMTEREMAALLEEHADRSLSEAVDDPEVRARFRLVSGYAMNVSGFMRYFRKRGEL